MTWASAERLARTLSFEGYALYPYRPDSTKNQKRWALGTLWPSGFARDADRSECRVECLVTGEDPRVRILARFLQIVRRSASGADGHWFEAIERSVEQDLTSLASLERSGRAQPFDIDENACELGPDEARLLAPLFGRLAIEAARLGDRVRRLRVELCNETVYAGTDRDEAYLHAFGAAHLLLEVRDGAFVSLLEPPAGMEPLASTCVQQGVWPVLVGEPGSTSTMLASPVILYDYPKIAPESPGDLCDSTEIDEILALRIQTLTESEKAAARANDERVRALLDRTGSLTAEQLAGLHGARRDSPPLPRPAAAPSIAPGDRVRLRPGKRGDVLDLALAGERATVVSVEQDLEGSWHVSVTVDRDPGRDLGDDGYPGHRFFFSIEELEPLE